MKKGFTLAELLIVLGITGITAAILLPTISNLMPDKTKIMYLKAYEELQRDIQSLASNSSLYPSCLEENNTSIGCSEHPLINTSKPLTKKFESYTGDTKLCKLLAFSMDTEESCKEESYTYNNSTFKNNLSFTTKNGMQWIVSPQTRTIESDKATYQSDIYVDVDPSKKSKNCLYDSVSCKEPDRFKFLVAADGSVIPADPMGLMYVNTRKSYMKNKKQKADGEVAALLTDELREFGYRPCGESNNATKTCNEGEILVGDTCQPVAPTCPEGQVWDGSTCSSPEPVCPDGMSWDGTTCTAKAEENKFCSARYMDEYNNVCKCGEIFLNKKINCVTLTPDYNGGYPGCTKMEYSNTKGTCEESFAVKQEIAYAPDMNINYCIGTIFMVNSDYYTCNVLPKGDTTDKFFYVHYVYDHNSPDFPPGEKFHTLRYNPYSFYSAYSNNNLYKSKYIYWIYVGGEKVLDISDWYSGYKYDDYSKDWFWE